MALVNDWYTIHHGHPRTELRPGKNDPQPFEACRSSPRETGNIEKRINQQLTTAFALAGQVSDYAPTIQRTGDRAVSIIT